MAALPALTTTEDPLRDALNKITNWPGGTTGGTAPRADVVNLGTTVDLANNVAALPPDPFATELAALQASNNALAAELGIGTTDTTAAAAPVVEPYRGDPGDANYWLSLSKGDPNWDYNAWNTQAQAKLQAEWDALTPRGQAIELAAGEPTPMEYSNAVGQRANSYGNWLAGEEYTPYVPTKSSSSSSLRNPGPSAPWQQSQQYWKDLAAGK